MAKRNFLSWLFGRHLVPDRKKIEFRDDIEDESLNDVIEAININQQIPKVVPEVDQIDNEYIIPINKVQDIWIALHNERKVSVSGGVVYNKFNSLEKDPKTGLVKRTALLSDGTGTIIIKAYISYVVSNNLDATYNVVGICRSEDGIRSYLDNCNITMLSDGVNSEKSDKTLRNTTYVDSNVEVVDSVGSSKSSNYHKNQRSHTGSNWTREFSGKGVRSDSSWQYWRDKAFKRDDYKCVQCGSDDNLTVDHIQPLSLGGKNELNNLQTLCGDCHEDKHYCNFLDKKFDANDNYGANYNPNNKIQAIIKAINNKSRVRIDYVDRKNVKSSRTILPGKVYKGYYYKGKTVCINCVYVDAYCDKDRDNRTFRLSRMKSVNNI